MTEFRNHSTTNGPALVRTMGAEEKRASYQGGNGASLGKGGTLNKEDDTREITPLWLAP